MSQVNWDDYSVDEKFDIATWRAAMLAMVPTELRFINVIEGLMSQTNWDQICQECQGVIPYGHHDFCSDECRQKYGADIRPCPFCGAAKHTPGEACDDRCQAIFDSLTRNP